MSALADLFLLALSGTLSEALHPTSLVAGMLTATAVVLVTGWAAMLAGAGADDGADWEPRGTIVLTKDP